MPKYRNSDWVLLTRTGHTGLEGPYLVAQVSESGKYMLSDKATGENVDGGALFEEKDLTLASGNT